MRVSMRMPKLKVRPRVYAHAFTHVHVRMSMHVHTHAARQVPDAVRRAATALYLALSSAVHRVWSLPHMVWRVASVYGLVDQQCM